MKIKKNLSPLILMLTLFVALSFKNTPMAFAVAEIYVYPEVTYAPKGSTFSLEVKISSVSELFAWQFNLTWDSTLMYATNASEGDFLNAWDQKPTHFFGAEYIDEIPGSVFVGATILGEDWKGTSGSGTLATVNFTVIEKGETPLNLTNTKLLEVVGAKISHTTKDGLFTNLAIPPVADFSYSPLLPEIGEMVTFNGSISYDPDGEIMNYTWDFGDDENATGAITTHSYEEAGLYSVKLTVNDTTGLINSKTVDLRIRYTHDIAMLNVEASKAEAVVGDDVILSAIALNAGTEPETFTITFYYAENVAGTSTVTNLQPDVNQTASFTWNTADVEEGTYKIKAVSAAVEGETNTGDNVWIDGTVTLTEASQRFPIELVAGGIGAGVVIVIVAILLIKRRGS